MFLGRRKIWLLALAVAVFAAVATARAEDDPAPIVVKPKRSSIGSRMLPHVLELAELRSPNIQKAKNIYDIAGLQYENARRVWYPKLDFSAVHGYQGTSPYNGTYAPTPYASKVDLVATETLYDNGDSFTKYRIAKSQLERAKIEFELARDKQLLDVSNNYYDWSAAIQQREIVENNRDLLRRQYNVLEAQYKQGMKTKRDVLRIETEMRRIEIDVINADNDVDNAFQKLSATVGMPRAELEQEEILGEEPKLISVEGKSEELTSKKHRQAQVVDHLKKEAQFSTDLSRHAYYPQIALTGEAGYHNANYLGNPGVTWDTNHFYDWNALITLTYNLWDWGNLGRNVQIAHINEVNVGATGEQTLLDLGNDLRNVMLQLRSFKEQVKMTRDLLALEQQSYSLLEAEYRNGRATYLDLITNLKSLIDARSKFNASYFGLKKQMATYSYHNGDLYEGLRQK
jgi:outer membrane protein